MSDNFPSQIDLKYWLNYNPETGVFTWKESPAKNVKAGQVAARKISNGTSLIGLNYKVYSAAVIAWIYHYGVNPDGWVSYKNKDAGDNRIDNLHVLSINKIRHNHKDYKNNSTGIRGVIKNIRAGYTAKIMCNGVSYRKYFGDIFDAEKWVNDKRKELH